MLEYYLCIVIIFSPSKLKKQISTLLTNFPLDSYVNDEKKQNWIYKINFNLATLKKSH